MFKAMDGRVRAGPLGATRARELRQPNVPGTVAPGAMVLANFVETKVAGSPRRRAEPNLGVTRSRQDGSRPTPG